LLSTPFVAAIPSGHTHNQDSRSYGELFYLLCDEIQDIDYETAIKQLMLFFNKLANGVSGEHVKSKSYYVKSINGLLPCPYILGL